MRDRCKVADGDVRRLQILAGALLAGVVMFAGVAVAIVQLGGVGNPGQTIVSLVMLGMTAAELVPFAIVSRLVTARSSNVRAVATASGMSPEVAIYQTRMIMRFALCEGACFANLIAYVLEHNWWSLAVVGGLVFVMLTMFPTRTKVEHWIETQQMLSQTEG